MSCKTIERIIESGLSPCLDPEKIVKHPAFQDLSDQEQQALRKLDVTQIRRFKESASERKINAEHASDVV